MIGLPAGSFAVWLSILRTAEPLPSTGEKFRLNLRGDILVNNFE